MTDLNKNIVNEDKIKIADEVVEIIAGISASKVEGVNSLSGGFSDGIAGILGRKSPGKGVKVEVDEDIVTVQLAVVVDYGSKIHLVAKKIQEEVRGEIEGMTGLKVSCVNVSIVGINMAKEHKKEEQLTETVETL